MRRYLLLFFLLVGALGAAAQSDGQPSATALYFDLVDGALVDSGVPYTEVRYEMTDGGHVVISDFMHCGRDLVITLGDADDEGYHNHLAINLEGAHDHYGRHLYLCPDYASIEMGDADTTDSFLADYCWFYDDGERTELCLTYWSEVRAKWNVCIVDFNREYVPCWNGKILYPEAASIDDLLSFTLTFEHAHSVTSGPSDLLGIIFDSADNPYAIAFCGVDFPYVGSLSVLRDAATINFVPFADLDESLQTSLRVSAGRLATHSEKASVVFAAKSFAIDEKTIGETLVREYEFSESNLVTDVLQHTTDVPASPRKAYDASGRQVDHYNKHRGHFYIDGSRKQVEH